MTEEKFSFDTIKDFDKHISLSIPNYSHIHELIESMSMYFVKPGTNVYDLGCSTGKLIDAIRHQSVYKNKIRDVKYIGYENSSNFANSNFDISMGDITNPEETPLENASLVMSIFTLQFLPTKERDKIIERIYKSLNPGGAFICCEKVYIRDGIMQDIFTFSYYDYKKKSFSEKEILDKQRDLRTIMTPLTDGQNEVMFRLAGFKYIETFFSSLFFRGWVMIK